MELLDQLSLWSGPCASHTWSHLNIKFKKNNEDYRWSLNCPIAIDERGEGVAGESNELDDGAQGTFLFVAPVPRVVCLFFVCCKADTAIFVTKGQCDQLTCNGHCVAC